MLEIKEGRPYLWRTLNYGDVAVHIESVNDKNGVIKLIIDGGEDTTPCRRFPELADGTAFTLANKLFRRHSPKQEIASMRTTVQNNIRKVRGIGKVAFVTTTPPRVDLESMSYTEIRAYARQHYSTIAKLTKKADIIAAIRAQEAKKGEVTF